MLHRYALALAFSILPAGAGAVTMEDLVNQVDRNGDKKLQAGPELDRYKALRAGETGRDPNSAAMLAEIAILEVQAKQTGGIPFAQLADRPPPNPCAAQTGLYIRNDKLDILLYSLGRIDTNAAKGASLSITNDRLTRTQTAQIDGVASYVIARDPCVERPDGLGADESSLSRYAIAPFMAAHGKLNGDPTMEKSELRFGVDAQFAVLGGGIFSNQFFTAAPYYQTDFRGLASAYGFNATWEPYLLSARLGGRRGPFSEWVDFFWKVHAEVDVMHVDQVGLTSLTGGTDYFWMGAKARAYIFPFYRQFDRKLVLTGTYAFYWDERSRTTVSLGSAALAYNFTPGTSVSFEYKKGTDKDTLQKYDQYLAKLNFKY